MRLIRRKSDNVVLYAIQDNEPYTLKNFLSFKGVRALDVNDTTHEAITAVDTGFPIGRAITAASILVENI